MELLKSAINLYLFFLNSSYIYYVKKNFNHILLLIYSNFLDVIIQSDPGGGYTKSSVSFFEILTRS